MSWASHFADSVSRFVFEHKAVRGAVVLLDSACAAGAESAVRH